MDRLWTFSWGLVAGIPGRGSGLRGLGQTAGVWTGAYNVFVYGGWRVACWDGDDRRCFIFSVRFTYCPQCYGGLGEWGRVYRAYGMVYHTGGSRGRGWPV